MDLKIHAELLEGVADELGAIVMHSLSLYAQAKLTTLVALISLGGTASAHFEK